VTTGVRSGIGLNNWAEDIGLLYHHTMVMGKMKERLLAKVDANQKRLEAKINANQEEVGQ
jgi:hypothetical protein